MKRMITRTILILVRLIEYMDNNTSHGTHNKHSPTQHLSHSVKTETKPAEILHFSLSNWKIIHVNRQWRKHESGSDPAHLQL